MMILKKSDQAERLDLKNKIMNLIWEPTNTINLVLCLIILVLGFVGYKNKHSLTSLYIGTAFGLFGFSHLMTTLDLAATLEIPLIIIRTFAYLIVLYSLYQITQAK